MANSALIQGAGQVYRAKAAKTLAIGSGLVKGGTDVATEYLKQKEERDKTDKQNATLATIYQQTAVNEQGLSQEDFAQIQKETIEHNQMIIDLSKQGLDPTLYQATLTNRTKELEGRLKTINNIAATRTMANGLIRAHGDDKIGTKLSEHFRTTKEGVLTEKIVNALAGGKYKYGKENGIVIIDGKSYNQTEIKEHVESYKNGMYNVFEAGGVRASLIDAVMKLETPEDLRTWKKAQEKMYNWKNPAVISKIKKELIDVWEQDAGNVNSLSGDAVRDAWLEQRTKLADEFANIKTPSHPGKQLFENINNKLNYELTTGGIVNYLKDNSGSIEYEGGKLIARSETVEVDGKEVSLEPIYDYKNDALTVWLADKDGETFRRQVTFNMGNNRDRSIFTNSMAKTQQYSKSDINKMMQYQTQHGIEGYIKSQQEISEIQNKATSILGNIENITQEDLQFLEDNKVNITDKDKFDQINKKREEFGMDPITDLNQQEQKLEVDKIEQVKVLEPVKKKRRMIWQEEFIDTGKFQDYLTTIGVKGSGFAYDGKGRVLDEIVNRKDFKDKFGKVYPANTYRTGHLATYPHDKTGMTITQGQIMGQEITFSNTGKPQLDTTIVQAKQTTKEKANEQFKQQYFIDRRNYSLRGKPGDDLIVYYKLSKDNPDIPELPDDKFVNFVETGKLDAEYRKAILDNSKEFSDELVKLVKKAEPNVDYSGGTPATSEPTQQTSPPATTPMFSPAVEEENEILPNSSGAIGEDFSIPKPTGNSKALKENEKVEAEKDANREKWVNGKVEETKWYKKPIMQVTTIDGKPVGAESRKRTTNPTLIKQGETDYISHKTEYINGKQVVTLYNEYGDIIAVLRQQ